MPYIEHIIGAVNVFDIAVVIVVPAYWPTGIVAEPIAAILEAVIPTDHLGTPHMERVAPTEMGTIIGVGDATILATAAVAVVATIVGNGLCLLPCGPLCLLGALRLRLALCLLGTLRLRLALWLSLPLRLLLALRLRLMLRRLGVLWLCLVLCLRGFSSAPTLLLFAFLCECRDGGSEKHK